MLENVSLDYFNLTESGFWMVLSFVCLVIYYKATGIYKSLALFSSFVLLTFGVSDFLEATYGSFLVPDMEWSFIWKIVDVIGLCGIFLWYVILRIKY